MVPRLAATTACGLADGRLERPISWRLFAARSNYMALRWLAGLSIVRPVLVSAAG